MPPLETCWSLINKPLCGALEQLSAGHYICLGLKNKKNKKQIRSWLISASLWACVIFILWAGLCNHPAACKQQMWKSRRGETSLVRKSGSGSAGRCCQRWLDLPRRDCFVLKLHCCSWFLLERPTENEKNGVLIRGCPVYCISHSVCSV